MAATFVWIQDSGTATGSPAKGTTRTEGVSNGNFKNADNPATSYTSAPIIAGNNSYTVYQAGKFTGTFNQILDAKWAHTAGTPGTGVTLKGAVTSTYATPSTSENMALSDISTPEAIEDGATVLFQTTGPEGADPTSTLEEAGYTQFFATQLLTTEEAEPGDTATFTFTLRYSEN